jgi:long-chain acyl-CoA synthetase
MATLDVAGTYAGKHILMTGVTGFVGKALLAWLMVHHPDVRKITCIVRPKAKKSPRERVADVLHTPPLQVVRDRMGAGLEAWVSERIDAVSGDLARPLVGLSAADRDRLLGDVDILVNVAAQVDFTPPLNDALVTNVEGALGALELARQLGVPYCHVSTCYVAGYAKGFIAEEIRPFECPNQDITSFDPEKELRLVTRLVQRIMEDREDPTLPAPRRRLRTEGEARSRALGWPNTYTYTKSLAEKLISLRAGDVRYCVVRPAIVESAWKFPLPGWSEGGNGSASFILMGYVGQRWSPSDDRVVLDLVPVDLVAKGLALAIAALLNDVHQQVYQLGTSDLNPLHCRRVTEIVNVWRHKQAEDPNRTALEKLFLRNTDSVSQSALIYDNLSAPAVARLAGRVSGWLRDAPVAKGGPVERAFQRARNMTEALERTTKGIEAIYEVYRPFVTEVDVRYKTRAIVEAAAMLSPAEQALYAYDAADIDWFSYFHDQHLPGLEEWIFPEMYRKLKKGITPDPITPPPIPGDLLDLLERAVGSWADNPFLRRVPVDGREESLTYADVQERATFAARRLAQAGVVPGDRVLLLVDRGPEWAIAYFGALYAGATAVPVDITSPPDTLVRLGDRSRASAWIVSRSLSIKPEIAAILPVGKTWLAEVICAPRPWVGTENLPALPTIDRDPGRIASILFTSGTTGLPRGVMLSHGNFLAVLRGAHGVYGLGQEDRFLSLLPLHHSFEFTAGLLFPMSRGASIAYPGKFTAESLGEILDTVQPTAMVGVPALWTALARKVNQGLDDLPGPARKVFQELMRHHGTIRDDFGINLGPLLFLPVHRALGGSLRHLVSGASALPESVLRDYYRWGFHLTSGYGLTEAAPVLSVAPPGTKRGDTVGPPIVGVDVRISEPGPDGIGEIVARGPNVMQGYLDDPEATKQAIRGGWLHTGDLGRIDDDGNVIIVGRAKDVIVASSGENVYPDELEDRLQGLAEVDEIAIVGLPDGLGGEKVVCVVVPTEAETMVGSPVVETSIRRSIAGATATLPQYWRPQEIRFRKTKLPRNATLKVSRKELRQQLLDEKPAVREVVDPTVPDTGRWLVEAMARAAGVPAGQVNGATRLGDDLPIDSLAWLDLHGLIERRQGHCPPLEELVAMATVGDVLDAVLGRQKSRGGPRVPLFYGADGKALDAPVKAVQPLSRLPEGVREIASAAIRKGHGRLSGAVLDVDVSGQAFIPEDRAVLVVSNHASHVDSGVLRYALGKLGDDLPLLAAQDYFFGTFAKDLFFGDLLDMVPADRHKAGLSGVRNALRILESGRSLGIFPEGTRSRDGSMAEFKPGAILIALNAGVDMLPVHIEGTHDVLRAGSSIPRGRRARVRIGRPIPHALLADRVRVQGVSMQAAADMLRESVRMLSLGGDALGPWDGTKVVG